LGRVRSLLVAGFGTLLWGPSGPKPGGCRVMCVWDWRVTAKGEQNNKCAGRTKKKIQSNPGAFCKFVIPSSFNGSTLPEQRTIG